MNNEGLLTQALYFAITAESERTAREMLDIVYTLSDSMDLDTVKSCRAKALERIFQVN